MDTAYIIDKYYASKRTQLLKITATHPNKENIYLTGSITSEELREIDGFFKRLRDQSPSPPFCTHYCKYKVFKPGNELSSIKLTGYFSLKESIEIYQFIKELRFRFLANLTIYDTESTLYPSDNNNK